MTTACDMLTKTAATYFAARHGRLDCLQYAHENGSPETTYVAALNTQLACLKYIYEFCGDEVSWEASELEGYGEKFSAPIRAHLKTVEASWRAGENLSAANIKPARRNQYTRSVCNYFVVYYSSVGFDFMASCCKTTSMAAKLGHLPCLQALHEAGTPWGPLTTYYAAAKGSAIRTRERLSLAPRHELLCCA
jgi:hypothetical protein